MPITIDSFLWHVKAVPAGAADIFRITYDVDRGEAEFVGTGQPRPFTTLDSDDPTILGTLTLPSTFRVRVLSTGDLFASLTVTLRLFNVFEAVFPLDFTTGLPSSETFAEGIPLSSDGHFKLVSAREGLPLGFGGDEEFFLECRLVPVPDVGRFARGPRARVLRGVIGEKSARLRAVLELPAAERSDLSGQWAAVLLKTNDTEFGAVAVDGLARRKHGWLVGFGSDGKSSILISQRRRRVVVSARARVIGGLPSRMHRPINVMVTGQLGELTWRARGMFWRH